MHEVKLEDAKEHLVDLLDAALKGEDVVILSDNKQMVRLVPVTAETASSVRLCQRPDRDC